MSSITTQILYQLIMSNIAPMIVSSCNSVYSSYFGKTSQPIIGRIDVDEEKELERLQMDRLLKWMNMIFEVPEETPESHREYKQELFNIYKTLYSDYKQYQQCKRYNNDLWVMSSYRKKNTKSLAAKILSDIKLFNEGLKMYTVISNSNRQNNIKNSETPPSNTTDAPDKSIPDTFNLRST